MPFSIVTGDILDVRADAVVVAANEQLAITGGVGMRVALAAGRRKLQRACDDVGECQPGTAVVTPAFSLRAKHIVHVVGPVWQGGTCGEEALLLQAYESALQAVLRVGDASVALPLISAGTYRYPADQALTVAVRAVRSFLNEHELQVTLVLYDRCVIRAGMQRLEDLASFLDEARFDLSYEPGASFSSVRSSDDAAMFDEPVCEAGAPPFCSKCGKALREGGMFCPYCGTYNREAEEPLFSHEAAAFPSKAQAACPSPSMPGPSAPMVQMQPLPMAAKQRKLGWGSRASRRQQLDMWLQQADEPLSDMLLQLIDERGLTDAQVYKRANISRQVFNKIKNDTSYHPKKPTVLALCVALELGVPQTKEVLSRAGYSLNRSSTFDLIVEYYIKRGIFDSFEINEALFAYDQPLLGAS